MVSPTTNPYTTSVTDREEVVVAPHAERSLEFLEDVPLTITAELGRAEISIRRLLSLAPGSILEIGPETGQAIEIRVNGRPTAKGEVVAGNDRYGVRITEVVDPSE